MVDFKTLRDVHLTGKRVLLRADYNVPLVKGKIDGNFRIRQSIPTIKAILEQKPQALIIISHLGRPAGKTDKDLSLLPVAKELEKLLNEEINFFADCVGEETRHFLTGLKPGSVSLLENVRFYPGEEENSSDFAKQLVETTSADVFVQDGFGVGHRAHASTDAITKLVPSAGGLLLEKEVDTITKVMSDPARPLTAVVGGAKISDKIEVLAKFVALADFVAVVGALANNFLLARGIKVGKSLIDKDNIDLAEKILKQAEKEARQRPFKFLVPVDGVVSTSTDGRSATRVVDLSRNVLADIEAYPKLPPKKSHSVEADERILDIGPMSASEIVGAIELSKTVVWSGTCGIAEVKGIAGAAAPFAHGSRMVAEAMIGETNQHKSKPFSFAGGGDTTAYIENEGMADDFSHVSTGGSASLELMAGKKLPGIEALPKK